jgi:hypothetical protein
MNVVSDGRWRPTDACAIAFQPPIAESFMHNAMASIALIGVSTVASLLAHLPRAFSTGVAAGRFNSKSGDIGLGVITLFDTFMFDLGRREFLFRFGKRKK